MGNSTSRKVHCAIITRDLGIRQPGADPTAPVTRRLGVGKRQTRHVPVTYVAGAEGSGRLFHVADEVTKLTFLIHAGTEVSVIPQALTLFNLRAANG